MIAVRVYNFIFIALGYVALLGCSETASRVELGEIARPLNFNQPTAACKTAHYRVTEQREASLSAEDANDLDGVVFAFDHDIGADGRAVNIRFAGDDPGSVDRRAAIRAAARALEGWRFDVADNAGAAVLTGCRSELEITPLSAIWRSDRGYPD